MRIGPEPLGGRRLSGLLAVLGGFLALALTLPFAAAYFRAYPGFDTPPPWVEAAPAALGNALNFAPPTEVYATYGRIFMFTYVLALPGLLALHTLQRGSSDRLARWGFGVLVTGLAATTIGVAGDYWADGAGFLIEVLGLLILWAGSAMYGAAHLRLGVLPRWVAWLLALAGPVGIVGMLLTGHIPSGPTLGFALASVGLGSVLWTSRR